MERTNGRRGLRTVHKDRWLRLHPFSGAAILLLDNFFFGLSTISGGLGLPVTMTLAFWTTLGAVWLVQRKWVGESRRMSFAKAFATGLIAAVPFSIAGTAVGAWILLSAGLSPHRRFPK